MPSGARVVVFSFRKGIGKVLNLLTQVLVVAIWVSFLVGIATGMRDPIPADLSFGVRFIAMLMFFWELAGAGGTTFWFFRQFAHAEANARLLAWLKANEAKIRNNELAFY